MSRLWPLLVFPVLGSALAMMFRPSERDPYSYTALKRPTISTYSLSLPDGEAIRFLGLPDPAGGVAFYLSETEVSPQIWKQYAKGDITFNAATEFCRELSALTGRTLRLPALPEWRQAARGGLPNAETAWGYGPHLLPAGLHFALTAPPSRPGPTLGYGFRDLAGGRWEWTAEGILIGGAWSEQNPEVLLLDHTWTPPTGYGDSDTGLRIVLEP